MSRLITNLLLMLLLVVGCETPIEQQDVYGCTDAAACNFNENANFDNATCEFPEEFYDCDGSCLADSDGDGICDELEISGCQDQTACNYHLDATDGESCWYANEGCLCADGEGAELDQCNVCDSNPNNDCDVCHEAFGEPTALYKVLPDFETMYPSSSILTLCDNYNDIFSSTLDIELSQNQLSYIFYEANQNSNCNILLSAPHSQKTYRYDDTNEDCSYKETHGRDLRSGVIGVLLNELTGCPTIVKKYKSDDPNYHHQILECTQTDVFQDAIGELLPYKQKILDYISQNESIQLVVDIHGWARTGDIDMGTMYGESLESEVGKCLPYIIEHILTERDISSSQNVTYTASKNESVTKFVHNYIDDVVDAIQFEIESEYRSCSSSRFSQLIYAFLEIIFISNYLYSNQIPTY